MKFTFPAVAIMAAFFSVTAVPQALAQQERYARIFDANDLGFEAANDAGLQYSQDQPNQFRVWLDNREHPAASSRTFPLLRVDNPAVIGNAFRLEGGYVCSLPDKSPPLKASFELITQFADGTATDSTVALTATDGSLISIPVNVPANTWPARVQLNLTVTGSALIQINHPVLTEFASDGTTTQPADSNSILLDKQIVRQFHGAALLKPVDSFDFSDWSSPVGAGYDRLCYQNLFDGVDGAAFIVGLGRSDREYQWTDKNTLMERTKIISDDFPAISAEHFAAVGRITGFSDRSPEPVDFRAVRLQLLAITKDGHHLCATRGLECAPNNKIPTQTFQLPITNPTASPVTHLEISLILPGGAALAFDEVDLVASRKAATSASSLPAAGAVPTNLRPAAILSPLVLDRSVTNVVSDFLTTASPVENVIEESGNGAQWMSFVRTPLNGLPRRIELLSQDAPGLKSGTFGITGAVFYEGLQPSTDMDGSAWFELTTDYADGTRSVTGTTAAYGPAGIMTGHSSDRRFAVVAKSNVQPARVRLDLLCRGTGRVRFSPLSLVQYEPTPVIAAVGPATPPPWWALPRFTRPAGFGLLGIMALAAIVFLIPGAGPSTRGWLFFLFALAEGSFGWALFLLGRGAPLFYVMPLLTAALAWLLPLISKWIATSRARRQELRKIYSLDVAT